MLVEVAGLPASGKSTVLRAARPFVRGAWDPLPGAEPATFIPRDVRSNALAHREVAGLRDWWVEALESTDFTAAQKRQTVQFLEDSETRRQYVRGAATLRPTVQEELLLHRAFSVFPRSSRAEELAKEYIGIIPVPEAAVLVDATSSAVLQRALARGPLVNLYTGIDSGRLAEVIECGRAVLDVMREALVEAGIPVLVLDSTLPADDTASSLLRWIESLECAPCSSALGEPWARSGSSVWAFLSACESDVRPE